MSDVEKAVLNKQSIADLIEILSGIKAGMSGAPAKPLDAAEAANYPPADAQIHLEGHKVFALAMEDLIPWLESQNTLTSDQLVVQLEGVILPSIVSTYQPKDVEAAIGPILEEKNMTADAFIEGIVAKGSQLTLSTSQAHFKRVAQAQSELGRGPA